MEELKGRAGIVTGASSGIGYAIAETLAGAGATVYVISRTGAVKEDMPPSHPNVVHKKGDVTDYDAMKAMIADRPPVRGCGYAVRCCRTLFCRASRSTGKNLR